MKNSRKIFDLSKIITPSKSFLNRCYILPKWLFLLPFLTICPEVFATVFSVAPTDQSQQYLGMIFGGSVGAVALGGGVNNPTLSMMFQEFNYIILTVGAIVLSYLGVISVVNTTREGEALGKKLSLWVPMRAFMGMLLMVPGPSSGYSVIQMTVMWVVLNGVGAANAIWDVVLSQLSLGVSVASGLNIQMQPSNLNSLTQNVLQASTCMNVINNYMPQLATVPGPFQTYGPVSAFTTINPIQQSPSVGTPTQLTQTATVKVGLRNGGGQLPLLMTHCADTLQ